MSERRAWYSVADRRGPFGPQYDFEFAVPAERTAAEVESLAAFLTGLARKDRSARILDLAAGTGRIAIPLAELTTASVVCLDLQLRFLRSEGLRQRTRAVCGDMRQLPFLSATFDCLLLLFTSFGYFSDLDNLVVLKEMSRCLMRRGVAVIDQPNYNRIEQHFIVERTKIVELPNGQTYSVLYRNRIATIHSDIDVLGPVARVLFQRRVATMSSGHRERLEPIVVRIYRLSDIETMARLVGLEIAAVTDSTLRDFNPHSSKRMWIHLQVNASHSGRRQ